MSENYSSGSPGSRSKGQFFTITFLLFQLVLAGLLIFYMLRKSEIGMNMLNSILH
ncbi:MAG: hypothetical protein U0X76_12935 [Bacteroidia bacterium]